MNAPRVDALPRLIETAQELRRVATDARRAEQRIGLVPTMGALHAGHASLVDAASRECDLTIVTVFVNPMQFGAGEDFSRYPRTLSADLQLLGGHGAQIVFAPATESMYGADHATSVEVLGPAIGLEGQFRPGHFRGVATIVLKLFNLVMPDRAYFGRKDFQQSLVVRRMVADLDLPIHIEVRPTIREADGLALSSRNRYLSPDERQRALAICKSLQLAGQWVRQGTRDAATILARMHETLHAADLKIDYVALGDPETLAAVPLVDRPTVALVAARVGATRLIDNELIG
jgi:pantoate--beta-alanine ligase